MQYVMEVFEYDDQRKFRVIDRDGEPWFVLSEVCKHLGIANAADAASRLDDDEKRFVRTDALGGVQRRVRIVNESGLYSIILRSTKPEARQFKKWVSSKVLPSIRKTGNYIDRVPAFIRRFNANWNRVDPGHFSVINELVSRVWGRLEMAGHVLADRSPDGTEIRMDISVGRLFSSWLRTSHPDMAEEFSYYLHETPENEVEARQYPYALLPMFIDFVENIWIPQHSERYLAKRDPAALPFLPRLLPTKDKRRTGMLKQPARKRFHPMH